MQSQKIATRGDEIVIFFYMVLKWIVYLFLLFFSEAWKSMAIAAISTATAVACLTHCGQR